MAEACRTCRWWNAHSADEKLGDCMHQETGVPHRYWNGKLKDGTGFCLDSFGPEETRPNYFCHAWANGDGTNG